MRVLKNWLQKSWRHKKEAFNPKKLLDVAKTHGLALVVIIIMWEIIEDILFPAIFFLLGMHVNPIFLSMIPVSWLFCLHWLAVPAMWWAWVKISGKKQQEEKNVKICDHDH